MNEWITNEAALEEGGGCFESAADGRALIGALCKGAADMLRRNLHKHELAACKQGKRLTKH